MAATKAQSRRRHRFMYLVAVAAIAAGLYFAPVSITRNGRPTAAHDLELTWVDGTGRLEIVSTGFRSRSAVDVSVGGLAHTQARADDRGIARLSVEVDQAAAGQPGITVIVSGRAPSGNARTLTSALPPRASARGPVDLMPWSVSALLAGVALVAMFHALKQRARLKPQRDKPVTPVEADESRK